MNSMHMALLRINKCYMYSLSLQPYLYPWCPVEGEEILEEVLVRLQSLCIENTYTYIYSTAGKFDGELNLLVWRSKLRLQNYNPLILLLC